MTRDEFNFIRKYIEFLETHLLEYVDEELAHDIELEMGIYQGTYLYILRKYKKPLEVLEDLGDYELFQLWEEQEP